MRNRSALPRSNRSSSHRAALPLALRLTALAAFCVSIFAATMPALGVEGRYLLEDAVSYFIVNPEGNAFTIDVQWRDGRMRDRPAAALIRVFDPHERLVHRRDLLAARLAQGEEIPDNAHRFEIPAGQPGVYRVIVSGFPGTSAAVTTEPALAFGVKGHVAELAGADGQLGDTWFVVPPGIDRLPVSAQGEARRLRIDDEHGRPLLELEGRNPSGAIDVPPGGGHLWRMRLDMPGRHRVSFGHVYPILCPNAATARAIGAGLTVLDDGTIAFHRFQQRAWELLKRYRALPPEDFEVPIPDLMDYHEHWIKEPVRNLLLFGAYGAYGNLVPILHEQNLDPASPWFGAIACWRGSDGRPREGNPHADYYRYYDVYRAESRAAETLGARRALGGWGRHMARETDSLAAIYTLDEPFNPLHKHPALLNRIVIGLLQDLMMIRDTEMVTRTDNVYYGGIRAFTMPRHTLAFALIAPHLPEDVREVATEGMRRFIDRNLIGQVASTTNQWSHYPAGILNFYRATGEDYYRQWVLRHADWIAEGEFFGGGQRPAGYMAESNGPDATYNGITLSDLAKVYNTLGEPRVKESVRRAYDLFNHTIAPDPLDPNSRFAGASDFSHRTPGSWWNPQWGAGLAIMADHLSEAGFRDGLAWRFDRLARTEEEIEEAQRVMTQRLSFNPPTYFDIDKHPNGGGSRIAGAGGTFDIYWRNFAQNPKPGALPMAAGERFARNFGNEFFAVRRPAYYALSYAGAPMAAWQTSRRPGESNRQHTFNGGGFSMFWSPKLGASLLGKNWGAVTAHTLIATQDGVDRWIDYWSVSNAFDAERPALTTRGRLVERPLAFVRTLRYQDDRVAVTLTVSADAGAGALRLDEFYENFPFLWQGEGEPGNLTVSFLDGRGRDADSGDIVRAILFERDGVDELHAIVFSQPLRCDLDIAEAFDYRDNSLRWGRIRAALPTQWEAGQTREFGYQVIALPKDRLPAEIERMVNP